MQNNITFLSINRSFLFPASHPPSLVLPSPGSGHLTNTKETTKPRRPSRFRVWSSTIYPLLLPLGICCHGLHSHGFVLSISTKSINIAPFICEIKAWMQSNVHRRSLTNQKWSSSFSKTLTTSGPTLITPHCLPPHSFGTMDVLIATLFCAAQ